MRPLHLKNPSSVGRLLARSAAYGTGKQPCELGKLGNGLFGCCLRTEFQRATIGHQIDEQVPFLKEEAGGKPGICTNSSLREPGGHIAFVIGPIWTVNRLSSTVQEPRALLRSAFTLSDPSTLKAMV
jgi:hypothetical protein